MIDFEEELKKFQPSLEVEEAEDACISQAQEGTLWELESDE